MTANRTRRLRTAVLIMIVCVPVSLCYEFIDSVIDEGLEGKISFVGVFIGIALAMPLALLEESRFDERSIHVHGLGCWFAKGSEDGGLLGVAD